MAVEGERRVAALVGHPRVGSRTAGVATALAEAIAALMQPRAAVDTIELGALGADVFDPADPGVADARERVEAAGVIVVMSPTYKGSYTGLLKVFLDHFAGGSWAGRVAIPAMIAGGPAHGYAADIHLRPLLEELGALCPATFFLAEAELPELDPVVEAWGARVGPSLAPWLSTGA